MAANKLQWRRIAKGDKLPCQSFLRKKNGEILKLSTGAGVTVGQDAYYLPVDEVIEEIKNYPIEESEDERIRKAILELVRQSSEILEKKNQEQMIAWLEKQGEQKPCMIQWKGDNLKEVIGFTGKDKNFDKWFASFEEYERYVHEHNNIFKLFNKDGSHYEAPVGAWIVKTPDGRIVASKAVLKQNSAEWSEEDEKHIHSIISTIECCKAQYKEAIAVIEQYDSDLDWLKSLRPQSQWKPSDAQMYNLSEAAHYRSAFFSTDVLIGLYDDLKKLKG